MPNVAGRTWPTKRNPDQFGAPANAAVGTIQGRPIPRDSSAATNAMPILQDAVWRIDALDHQYAGANPKIVRNLGWGGSVLDTRCGSTTVPDSNDPLFLQWNGTNYIYIPSGSGSNRLDAPYESAFNTTDLDLRAKVALDNWDTTGQSLIQKTSGSRSFQFYVWSNALRLYWSADGTNWVTSVASSSLGQAAGSVKWVRATLDVDNGAGKYEVKFYTSDDGSIWTQLGATTTGASTTSVFTNTSRIDLMGDGGVAGKFFRGQVMGTIDGSAVLDVDASVIGSGSATSITALTSQTVAIVRNTSGRKSVAVVAPVWLFGTDDFMQLTSDLSQNFRIYDDSRTMLSVYRIWGTPTGSLLDRRVNNDGWQLRLDTGNVVFSTISPYANTAAFDTGARTANTTTIVLRLSKSDKSMSLFGNGSRSTLVSNNNPPMVAYNNIFYVGRRPQSNSYYDGELIASAIWYRDLTPAEISTISTYYQTRWP